ncbi:TetR/AcrR family transcriptional regulator [Micromonospora purpureochromogenes]|uniref:TetR/AcrR family transcriptional regulator n=1 Tax=Micromonospora purpureochromogenes TaxID=47872 RepID=UPI003625AB57
MLDTCAALLDEMGYDRLTTTLIAERADVAIGSVYQFFPDKRAIVQALMQRNLEAYLQRLENRFDREGLMHWSEGVDASIDEYVVMHRTVPGFRALHFGDALSVRHGTDEPDSSEIASHLARALIDRFAVADSAHPYLVLQIAVTAADALIKLAFRRRAEGDEEVLAEARALAREYLRPHLPLHRVGGDE